MLLLLFIIPGNGGGPRVPNGKGVAHVQVTEEGHGHFRAKVEELLLHPVEVVGLSLPLVMVVETWLRLVKVVEASLPLAKVVEWWRTLVKVVEAANPGNGGGSLAAPGRGGRAPGSGGGRRGILAGGGGFPGKGGGTCNGIGEDNNVPCLFAEETVASLICHTASRHT